MSGTESVTGNPVPGADELIKNNPKVDGAKVREAQELLEELRRGGVGRPSYGIDSPYERRPVSPPESSQRYP
jgi:hypothetical protein